jgi:hypothetical protein
LHLKAKAWKPVFHLIGARVERNRALSSYGGNWIQLVQPHRGGGDGSFCLGVQAVEDAHELAPQPLVERRRGLMVLLLVGVRMGRWGLLVLVLLVMILLLLEVLLLRLLLLLLLRVAALLWVLLVRLLLLLLRLLLRLLVLLLLLLLLLLLQLLCIVLLLLIILLLAAHHRPV